MKFVSLLLSCARLLIYACSPRSSTKRNPHRDHTRWAPSTSSATPRTASSSSQTFCWPTFCAFSWFSSFSLFEILLFRDVVVRFQWIIREQWFCRPVARHEYRSHRLMRRPSDASQIHALERPSKNHRCAVRMPPSNAMWWPMRGHSTHRRWRQWWRLCGRTN